MSRLRNIAMRDYQESVTTRQTHRQTDRQTEAGQSDPYVPLCCAGDTIKKHTKYWFKSKACWVAQIIKIHQQHVDISILLNPSMKQHVEILILLNTSILTKFFFSDSFTMIILLEYHPINSIYPCNWIPVKKSVWAWKLCLKIGLNDMQLQYWVQNNDACCKTVFLIRPSFILSAHLICVYIYIHSAKNVHNYT